MIFFDIFFFDPHLVADKEFARGVRLGQPEWPGDDIHILVNRGELPAKFFKSAPVVPVESHADLGADVGHEKGVVHG